MKELKLWCGFLFSREVCKPITITTIAAPAMATAPTGTALTAKKLHHMDMPNEM